MGVVSIRRCRCTAAVCAVLLFALAPFGAQREHKRVLVCARTCCGGTRWRQGDCYNDNRQHNNSASKTAFFFSTTPASWWTRGWCLLHGAVRPLLLLLLIQNGSLVSSVLRLLPVAAECALVFAPARRQQRCALAALVAREERGDGGVTRERKCVRVCVCACVRVCVHECVHECVCL